MNNNLNCTTKRFQYINTNLAPAKLPVYSERIILKLLFEHNGLELFKESYEWDSLIGESLGVSESLREVAKSKEIEEQLKMRLAEIEQQYQGPNENSVLETNLIQLKHLLNLSDCEIAIFRLAIYTKMNLALKKVLSCFSGGLIIFIPILSSLLNFVVVH